MSVVMIIAPFVPIPTATAQQTVAAIAASAAATARGGHDDDVGGRP